MNASTLRVVAAYAVMCAIWGTTWLAIKYSLAGLPPLVASGTRFVLAALFLCAVRAIVRPQLGPAPPASLVLVLATTLFGGSYGLTYFAETRLPSGLVAVLFGTMPFFISLFGALMFRTRVEPLAFVAALVALAGVALISLNGAGGDILFVAATLLASALSASAYVYLARFAESDPLQTLPPAMLLAGVATAVGGALITPPNLRAALALPSVLATVYLAICGSGVTFFLNHWLLRRLSAWTVGLSALVVPVIAVAVGAFVAHERLGLREWCGAALVIAGVGLAIAPANVRRRGADPRSSRVH